MTTKFAVYTTVATKVPLGKEFKEFMVGMASDGAAVTHASRFVIVMTASLASINGLSNVALVKCTDFKLSRKYLVGFLFQGCLLVHDINSCYYLVSVVVGHDQSNAEVEGEETGAPHTSHACRVLVNRKE